MHIFILFYFISFIVLLIDKRTSIDSNFNVIRSLIVCYLTVSKFQFSTEHDDTVMLCANFQYNWKSKMGILIARDFVRCDFDSSMAREICIYGFELGHHWSRQWLVACSAPSHYLDQCRIILKWIQRNKLQWNSSQYTLIFTKENAVDGVFCDPIFHKLRKKRFPMGLDFDVSTAGLTGKKGMLGPKGAKGNKGAIGPTATKGLMGR